jgi:hypothetical protein
MRARKYTRTRRIQCKSRNDFSVVFEYDFMCDRELRLVCAKLVEVRRIILRLFFLPFINLRFFVIEEFCRGRRPAGRCMSWQCGLGAGRSRRRLAQTDQKHILQLSAQDIPLPSLVCSCQNAMGPTASYCWFFQSQQFPWPQKRPCQPCLRREASRYERVTVRARQRFVFFASQTCFPSGQPQFSHCKRWRVIIT